MTDADLDRLLAVHCSGPPRTHWDGCEFSPAHDNCAVAKLVAEVRRLRDLAGLQPGNLPPWPALAPAEPDTPHCVHGAKQTEQGPGEGGPREGAVG